MNFVKLMPTSSMNDRLSYSKNCKTSSFTSGRRNFRFFENIKFGLTLKADHEIIDSIQNKIVINSIIN